MTFSHNGVPIPRWVAREFVACDAAIIRDMEKRARETGRYIQEYFYTTAGEQVRLGVDDRKPPTFNMDEVQAIIELHR